MTPFDKLLVLIDTTPRAADLIRAAHEASRNGRHSDSLILNSLAADWIHHHHPADVPDVIQLRDVLAKFFLD